MAAGAFAIQEQMPTGRTLLLFFFLARSVMAWHDPVHELITRVALQSLPPSMRRHWAAESTKLTSRYCLYPDIYHNAEPAEKARMKAFCEVGGRPIHNVTWKRGEDIQSLEYLLRNVADGIQSRDSEAAAQYAGTLAHFIEDSTCPAHALTPPDSPLSLMRDLLPPPAGKEGIRLHTVIERSSPPFDLDSRAPQTAGGTLQQAAATLLDHIYSAIRGNRAGLIELVRAAYADDQAAMDRFRLKAATTGAEILADAYYTAFSLAGMATTASSGRTRPLPIRMPRDLSDGTYLLPNGWSLSPAGKQVEVGGLPLKLALIGEGRYALVTSNGYSQHFIGVIDLKSGTMVQRIPIKQGWFGLLASPDGRRVFASAGAEDLILVYQFSEGKLTPSGEIKLKPGTFAAGMQISKNGSWLYVAGNLSHTLEIIEVETGRVIASIPVGVKPYNCAITADEKTAYVTNWGEDTVAAIDLGSLRVARTIKVQDMPNDLALAHGDGRLFVANGNRNTVSTVDTAAGSVIEQIDVVLAPEAPPGSTPNALALSSDGKTLYVANADNNSVAVIDVSTKGRSVPRGFIPTGWYPTAIAITDDGKRLIVANGKGSRSQENATLWKKGDSDPNSSNKGYIAALLEGTVSLIDIPDAATLARYSQQVHRNSPYAIKRAFPKAPFVLGPKCPIRYVVYIIKENRTYDSVLGDMREGNGDPEYCLFPEAVTPNHHALAREFVLLDNVYHDAEVSADGHHWVTSAYATDYVEKFWPSMYAGRGRKERPSLHDDPTAFSKGGFLWDLCARAGLSYRNYGEFARVQGAPPGHVRPATPSLVGHVHPTYLGADAIRSFSDRKRLELWLAEFREFEEKGDMPRLQVLSLPGDHTVGTVPGFPTPRAMMAENDYALGRIVEAVSKSRFWKSTAIFVIEDDTQGGPDHVDSHRTVALVASPYIRRGYVDSTMYSSSSVLRSMEMLLGLAPMSQYDAAATPMWTAFQKNRDLRPFVARPARVPLDEMNSSSAYGARRSMELPLDGADEAPDQEFNEILWKAVKGESSPAPPRRVATFVRPRD
jgi:YVTN family beta-propeller protein